MSIELRIESQIIFCLAHRDPNSSICPSEVARALSPPTDNLWRKLMPQIRRVISRMVEAQQVIVTRRGEILRAQDLTGGPIRIRRGTLYPIARGSKACESPLRTCDDEQDVSASRRE